METKKWLSKSMVVRPIGSINLYKLCKIVVGAGASVSKVSLLGGTCYLITLKSVKEAKFLDKQISTEWKRRPLAFFRWYPNCFQILGEPRSYATAFLSVEGMIK